MDNELAAEFYAAVLKNPLPPLAKKRRNYQLLSFCE